MRRLKNGVAQPAGHRVVGKGEKWHMNDIIFPKIDMCLIMLAGWFSRGATKNNFDIRSFTQIPAPPWLKPSRAKLQQHYLHLISD